MSAQLVPFPAPKKYVRHTCEVQVAEPMDVTGENALPCGREAIGFCSLCYAALCDCCAEYPCFESSEGHKIVGFEMEGKL